MKKLVLLLFVFCHFTFAGTSSFDLNIDLSIDGKLISSPRIIAKEGELASITQNSKEREIFLDVLSSSINSNDSILMKFTIGTINKNGDKIILATPQIIAKENHSAQVIMGDLIGKSSLSITVLAKKDFK